MQKKSHTMKQWNDGAERVDPFIVSLFHCVRNGVRAALVISLMFSCAAVGRAEDTVGLWVKNTTPMPVTVSVDGAEACKLEAPVYKECKGDIDISKITKGKKPEKKFCTTNNLKISCITNVNAAGANVSLLRLDGVEYNLRAAKGGTLYLCIEPSALTDCFGKKLQ